MVVRLVIAAPNVNRWSCTQVQDGWPGCWHQLTEKTPARCDTPLGQVRRAQDSKQRVN